MSLIIPTQYKTKLSIIQTQEAIKDLKDFFEHRLGEELRLTRVSSPLFVLPETGTNDNLNGIEKAVSFEVPDIGKKAEIVQSLAKWKRMALKKYGLPTGRGIYTDMNAIRKDEELDNIHSIYVDQWDWELIIDKKQRSRETLEEVVKKIYKVFKETEEHVQSIYPEIQKILPEEITFITSQELLDLYPELTPKEREDKIVKDKGAVFLMQIGKVLSNGEKHDGRSPDYDDWELNGDILFYNPVLGRALELSSMGIRVDEESLDRQLRESGCDDRRSLDYHQALLKGELPYTIGGGIGQSRICMYFLNKAHIGEVQVGVWPKEMIEECYEAGISLL
ncbi:MULTISPECIES: aspartate--ammonia ligase [Romboutsia]|uniref:Aspartate--ammonia ligase n=1 Tax=Romboutsia hominis TaxID=1507512 RepID=A0A2P2BU16_9FIRM|nr:MULTISPECIES: aspartate--ammonia ligase [Romboutsia]MCH1961114.1 aspartate--ammonia ligase [Romboutsia hominis]MCH1968461.1 aspartate--ammonia ligase [Romboutsia hominis]MDB8789385.1 aspartate--ammonia ligase [Romboutsia sp. 1001216sp1]MDB8802041.1 aspartate--ammonia ligase [Romboutsia sp. 1001216sp1]MDB8804673.1 aspartate--ammonia ligase [Romboutsia sp. 1001216sp1]